MRRPLLVLLAFTALGQPALGSAQPISAPIAKAVADPARPKTDVATDPIRKPAETLAFAGVKAGMKVGEFYPGSGYFTRMINDIVGPTGHVYGIENLKWVKGGAPDGAKYSHGAVRNLPFGTVDFPEPLDLAWVTQNYHDLKIAEYGVVDTAAFNRAVFKALKPGGIFMVLDHEAPKGTDVAGITRLHRIEKAQVIREVTAAGFKLVGESNFLHNPADDHTLSIFDKAIQDHTDQYALKFMKPR